MQENKSGCFFSEHSVLPLESKGLTDATCTHVHCRFFFIARYSTTTLTRLSQSIDPFVTPPPLGCNQQAGNLFGATRGSCRGSPWFRGSVRPSVFQARHFKVEA